MNYKLRSEVIKDIRRRVKQLLERRIKYVHGAFPLSFEEIKRAVMTSDQHRLVRDLQDTGFGEFRSHNTVSAFVDRVEYGTRRSAVVHLGLPQYCLMPRQVFLQFRTDKRISAKDLHEERVTTLYRLLLDDDQKAKLAEWTTRIIRETRLQDMTNWAAWKALDNCPTTGHLLALWPNLATFATDAFWRARFNNPPKRLKDFAPRASLVEMMGQEMEIADTILNAAVALDESYELASRDVKPTLVAWEWLEKDRAYDSPAIE